MEIKQKKGGLKNTMIKSNLKTLSDKYRDL